MDHEAHVGATGGFHDGDALGESRRDGLLANDRNTASGGEFHDFEVRLGRSDDIDEVGFLGVQHHSEIGPRIGARDAVECGGFAGFVEGAVGESDNFDRRDAGPSLVLEAAEIAGAEANAPQRGTGILKSGSGHRESGIGNRKFWRAEDGFFNR